MGMTNPPVIDTVSAIEWLLFHLISSLITPDDVLCYLAPYTPVVFTNASSVPGMDKHVPKLQTKC